MRGRGRTRASPLLFGKVRDLLETGRPSAAERLLRRGPCPRAFRAERWYLLGEASRLRGAFREAADRFCRCVGCGPDADPWLWTEAALSLAGVLRSLGLTRGAGAVLRRAGKVCGKRGLGRSIGERLELERALLLRAQGRYALSVGRLRSLLRAAKDARTRAYLLWAMGGALRFQGRLGAAESAFRRSLALARGARDRTGEGYALLGLGGALRMGGRVRDSLSAYRRAAGTLDLTEDLFGRAYAHCGMGNALRRLGRVPEALGRYRRARALYLRLGDEVDGAYVDWGLGLLLGRSARLKTARKVFKAYGDARGEVLCLLGLAQMEKPLVRRAARLEREAAALARTAGLALERERSA